MPLYRLVCCLAFLLFLPFWTQAAPVQAAPVQAGPVQAGEQNIYDSAWVRVWLADFRKDALAAGVSGDFFDRAFADFMPSQRVISASKTQPERIKTPEDYIDLLVTEKRIAQGRERLAQHVGFLETIERLYGVDRHILTAIWGVESNFGENMGRHQVVHALATLALEGSRVRFARRQLLALLPILEKEKLPVDVSGSWAGAMGQMQFIPTTYADYAIDHDKDGRRDIWNNVPDSLGSAANYLRASGWVGGLFWGAEVRLPENFDFAQYKSQTVRPLKEWLDEGYVLAAGKDARMAVWHKEDMRLLLPKKTSGLAFLVTRNFDALLKYNNSDVYAIAIGHLADRLRGAGAMMASISSMVSAASSKKNRLTKNEIKTAQRLLTQMGFDTGGVDGIDGARTKEALLRWQAASGMAQEGALIRPMLYKISAAALILSNDEIRLLQEKLSEQGFDPGLADGLMGRKTRAALRRWQEKSGLPVDGHPDRDILTALVGASDVGAK